jgi:signal transduction histidine kinase
LANELEAELKNETLCPEKRDVLEDILYNLRLNANKINEHGKRADSIVRSMLQHSRLFQPTRDDRHQCAAGSIRELELSRHARAGRSFNLTIEKDYDESVGKLEVAPQDISRVFLNIINNACYAVNEKGKQTVMASPHPLGAHENLGDKIEIRIRDNGNGIPVDIRKKFSILSSRQNRPARHGTGLSISYDIIVQVHRGEIKVETEEGRLRVVVRLPLDRL